MKDKTIVWISAGAIVFWLAILNPGATAGVLKQFRDFGRTIISVATGK
jgi:hypothetical protein